MQESCVFGKHCIIAQIKGGQLLHYLMELRQKEASA